MGKVIKWLFIGGFGVVALSFVFNMFGVLGTAVTAPGKVINKTLQTDNIIHNYEWFYDVNASYDARVKQVRQYEGFFTEETDRAERTRLRTEMAAMQQTCRDLATKYNANSEKMNRSIFKGWSLPHSLSMGDCG